MTPMIELASGRRACGCPEFARIMVQVSADRARSKPRPVPPLDDDEWSDAQWKPHIP
jgi:hypothetical protein